MEPVRLLRTRRELQHWCGTPSTRNVPLHFVPTMGALHPGHLSLIERAGRPVPAPDGRRHQPRVLVSLFVNPLQFGPGEDFQSYPRTLEADRALAEAAGASALFVPTAEELFPGGDAGLTRVCPPPALLAGLCARHRPGHFEGVATVVCRLLGLIRPEQLWLGEKDWQQLVVLRRVVADLGLPLQIRGCPTWREADGVAGSSRNRYLSPSQRLQAAGLPRALETGRALVAAGERSAAVVQQAVCQGLEAAALAVEYAELVVPQTLAPVTQLRAMALLAVAVRCGPSRLIDHTVLMTRLPIVAIDGPAGAGKSTVTRAFARRLGLIYLDTGAMYRAVTWWVQRQGADPADAAAVAPLLEALELRLDNGPGGEPCVTINGIDITTAIRSPDVTAQVSVVAAHACVREALTRQQQGMGERGGLVAEGRDIGTAVFPDAELKVFLTATVAERARRRALDLAERGFAVPAGAELEAQIAERDRLDSTRAVAPLLQAEDAVEVITDGMAIEAVIERLTELFRERVPEEAWPDPA